MECVSTHSHMQWPARYLGVLVWLVLSHQQVLAMDYYVSGVGSDTNTGIALDSPWRTIGKVRGYAFEPGFKPGDMIQFAGGETFDCMADDNLFIQADRSHGTAQQPITICSYGNGRATLQANGCGAISIWAPPAGSVGLGWVIRDLNIVGTNTATSGEPVVGISVWNGSSQKMDYVRIDSVDVSKFAGDGINLGRSSGASYLTNVSIRQVRSSSNFGLRGQKRPTGSGIIVGGTNGAVIERCVAFDNGISNTFSAGPCGIWCWDSRDVVIQSCEAYAQKTSGGDGNGFDIDGGCYNCLIQYCYSHDNAGPGFLFAQFDTAGDNGGNIIRYCISQNDVRNGWWGAFTVWGDTKNSFGFKQSHFYNNTIYVSAVSKELQVQGKQAVGIRLSESFSGITIRNNIVVLADQELLAVESPTNALEAATFQGNCWWNMKGDVRFKLGNSQFSSVALWRLTGQERDGAVDVGICCDPQLVGVGTAGTVGLDRIDRLAAMVPEYQLQATSPLTYRVDQSSIAVQILNAGEVDFFGNPLTPNRVRVSGAHTLVRNQVQRTR